MLSGSVGPAPTGQAGQCDSSSKQTAEGSRTQSCTSFGKEAGVTTGLCAGGAVPPRLMLPSCSCQSPSPACGLHTGEQSSSQVTTP